MKTDNMTFVKDETLNETVGGLNSASAYKLNKNDFATLCKVCGVTDQKRIVWLYNKYVQSNVDSVPAEVMLWIKAHKNDPM